MPAQTMDDGFVERQVRRRLEAADAAASRGAWPEVLDHARHVLLFDPEHADAKAFEGAALRALDPSAATEPDAAERTLDDLVQTVERGRSAVSEARAVVHDVRELAGWTLVAWSAAVPAVAAASTATWSYITGTLFSDEKLEQLRTTGPIDIARDPGLLLELLPLPLYFVAVLVAGLLLDNHARELGGRAYVVLSAVLLAALAPGVVAIFRSAWGAYDHRLVGAVGVVFVVLLVSAAIEEVRTWSAGRRDRARLAEMRRVNEELGALVRSARAALDARDVATTERLLESAQPLLARRAQLEASLPPQPPPREAEAVLS